MIAWSELTIVIPALNEAGHIGTVLRQIREALPEVLILVIDDGSTDDTRAAAQAIPGVRVIRHNHNKGNGACIKTALKNVSTTYMGVVDADGQHDPKFIAALWDHMPDCDMVIGARTGNHQQVNFVRAWGNAILRSVASSLAKEDIPDLTSGFRIFKKDVVAQFAHIYPDGFSFPTTSTLACMTNGYAVTFIPVHMPPRQAGESKIRVWKDGWRFFKLIFRMINIFAPSRLLYPLSILFFASGIAYTIFHISYIEFKIPGGSVLAIILGAIFMGFGMVMDQVASLRVQK